MKISTVLVAITSLLFLMIGLDKFISFMQPPCSLMDSIPVAIWKALGVLQIAGGVLIWIPAYRKFVAGFFLAFMLFFTIYHILENTYDVGGAIFMMIILGLLFVDPSFFKKKSS